MSTLKERLLELRADQPGVSNADLAREAGVKPPSVHGWFSGDTKSLKGKSLNAVCSLYGAHSEWVEKGAGPKYRLKGEGVIDLTALDKQEMQLVMFFRKMKADHQHEILQTANKLFVIDNPARSPANPFPSAPLPTNGAAARDRAKTKP